MQERVVKIILPIKQKESGLELLDSEADVKTKTKMSKIYMVFVLLSTVVAAIGLMKNNVAIVIGAMVIEPLIR